MKALLPRAMFLLLACATAAKPQSAYNPRDDQFRYLGMARAKAELSRAEEEYDRARKLAGKGMLSASELSERRVAFERVRIDFLQQSLSTLLGASHLLINAAVKERRPDGSLRVHIELESIGSATPKDAQNLAAADSALGGDLLRDVIPLAFVSMKADAGAGGAIISQPYERPLRDLRGGQRRALEFTLLKDVSEAVVSVAYGDKVEERRVWLGNAGPDGSVLLRASQFSLEADFGGPVAYDLTLERSGSGDTPLRLGVEGLPDAVRYEFRDPDTKARVVQVRLPQGTMSKHLQLVATLPAASEVAIRPDIPLKFEITVMPTDAFKGKIASTLPLELIPRGVAHAELRATSLYFEVAPGDSIVTEVAVKNVGSRDMQNVVLEAEAPAGWTAHAEPRELALLRLGETHTAHVTLSPVHGASVGDYEFRLRTVARATSRRLDDEDKILHVRIASRFGVWATAALLTALVLMTLVVVQAARKIGRR